jgi:hypothetical protein
MILAPGVYGGAVVDAVVVVVDSSTVVEVVLGAAVVEVGVVDVAVVVD